MFAAKLTTPIEITTQVDVFNVNKKSCDAIFIKILQYELNGKELTLELNFIQSKEKTQEEFLDPNDPKEDKFKYYLIKHSNIMLLGDEISAWGSDDKTLYEIVANKYNLQIAEYITFNNFS